MAHTYRMNKTCSSDGHRHSSPGSYLGTFSRDTLYCRNLFRGNRIAQLVGGLVVNGLNAAWAIIKGNP